MTLAVVVVAEPTPTAVLDLDGRPVVCRLLDMLTSLDVGDSCVIARPEYAALLRERGYEPVESKGLADDLREIARVARSADGPIILTHGDVVAHQEIFARLVLNSKAPASAAVARVRNLQAGDIPTRPVVRTRGDRVVSAGSRYHQVTDPNAVFRGVLRVSAEETGTLATVADRFADLADAPDGLSEIAPIRRRSSATEIADDGEVDGGEVDDGEADGDDPAEVLRTTRAAGDDAPALLLVGLVRSGVMVTARGSGRLLCERVLDQGQADAARRVLASVDEDRIRLDAAVKNNDGFFTTYAVSTYSRFIARWAARRGMTPNGVTAISMGVSVVAAAFFATGQRWGMIVGAVCLYFAFVFDCVDGQLARYTRQFSTLGAWLDATFDRAKEYTVFAGLAAGSTAAAVTSGVHGGDVWFLAVAALTAQTCRHMIDFAFGASRRRAAPEPIPVLQLATPDDSVLDAPETGKKRPRGGMGSLAVRLSGRSEKFRALHWFKKIIVLPIGERFALIAITAALFNARVTFIALLAWGGLAAAYTLSGRVLRSLAAPRAAK